MKISIIIILFNVFIIGDIKLVNSITEKEWWQHATIYQIYPRSFKDSDGDGIGDIQGIISKLSHLKEIGVNAIWMSPMFQSANIDFGYDVIDFFEIHNEYGTMEDFDEFMVAADELDIRILLDFVPNHSSDENEWFINSANSVAGYEDYYVWHNGTDDGNSPPNNWISVFGGPAWTWHPIREQWYLHQFFPGQPDLNYRNPNVVEEMNGVIRFWLEKGVSGFRVDAVNHLFEDTLFRDEPRNYETTDETSYEWLDHIYTKDLPEVYDMIYYWRAMIDEWATNNSNETKIFVTEAYASRENTMRYYKSLETGELGSMPYNFELIFLNHPDEFSAQRIKGGIDGWFDYMPAGFTAPWATGSHDHNRVASRLGPGHVGIMNTINLMLPGTSISYYGEEIGMTDNYDFEISDYRDVNRTPMQWDSSIGAGFSTNSTTWLPINSNYEILNVEVLKAANRSDYHHFIELTTLRMDETIINGDIHMKSISSDIFAFIRQLTNQQQYVIVTNSGSNQTVDLTIFKYLPDTLEIVASSKDSLHRIGDTINTAALQMNAFDALVLKTMMENCPPLSHGSIISIYHLSLIPLMMALLKLFQ